MELKGIVVYTNRAYQFQMVFPRWWKSHVFIGKSKTIGESEAEIHFNLKYRKKYKGKVHTNIFSVVIFKMSKKRWLQQFQGSPLQFLGEKWGRVFAAIAPEEAPEEFMKKDLSDYDRCIPEFRMLVKMENEDLPNILKSFRFRTDKKRN